MEGRVGCKIRNPCPAVKSLHTDLAGHASSEEAMRFASRNPCACPGRRNPSPKNRKERVGKKNIKTKQRHQKFVRNVLARCCCQATFVTSFVDLQTGARTFRFSEGPVSRSGGMPENVFPRTSANSSNCGGEA